MIKQLTYLILGVLVTGILTTSAHCNELNLNIPTIEVKGRASILAVPDRFSLSIAIAKRGRFTDKIRAVIDSQSKQVIELAQSLGVKSRDINSASARLQVITNKPSIIVEGIETKHRVGNTTFSNNNPQSNQFNKVYVGVNGASNQVDSTSIVFELTKTINIHFSNIDDYDSFMNRVIKFGVSRISPLAISVENTDKYYQQALVQAFNNAKEKATKIANHSKTSLDKLLYFEELSTNVYQSRLNPTSLASEIAPNNIYQVGKQAINANVLVKFSIQE